MLIHYLQQRGFLPVLQEVSGNIGLLFHVFNPKRPNPCASFIQLYEGEERPAVMAGDWNIWYQDDISVVVSLSFCLLLLLLNICE